MFRAAPRLIVRPALRTAPLRSLAPTRRFISTAPPTQKRRSFKSLVARLGIAGAIIYYYNTVDVFADEPRQLAQPLPETEVESEHLPTIESISEERKRRQAVQAQLDAQKQKEAEARSSSGEGDIEGLEEEADQQGAFNPETGEINWDCPCLGGMAHGPCGDQFKAAFSCFVYSKEEPKGMDCIDKFKDMQNCFREYPEVYGSELDSDADEEDDMSATPASEATETPSRSSPTSTPPSDAFSSNAQPTPSSDASTNDHAAPAKGKISGEPNSKPQTATGGLVPEEYKPNTQHNPMVDARGDMSSLDSEKEKSKQKPKGDSDTERANKAKTQVKSQEPVSESESIVPKASHDAGAEGTIVVGRK
ncbi:mitochondrial intermembrane space import and assembly protein 40 [Pyrenophora tritici-repentis]|nr:Mitochondrial intermembrane space import and assembly protein 40 [Pyrenophora tritici-repentis]KAF7447361.1 Mitochondrial intermembrane space import and assembly protein [Pyrenophora tritici-repentis]KAG9382545.1 Mitochondrial intermembrane space import and assembly protein 40 [Pyrenophora tritici-repentis]KAI0575482.1 Mitochondrial intermembrane space import and assembly protein 40 [Pyrenophora tritici-repentis]KAI1533750.1 mitochondrial intermembrane space import and assembly protein 40 [P